jgi:hypothetical protein
MARGNLVDRVARARPAVGECKEFADVVDSKTLSQRPGREAVLTRNIFRIRRGRPKRKGRRLIFSKGISL